MDGPFQSKPLICFEIEKVINISSDGNYQVQWAPAWVSRYHLVGCENLIQEFLEQQSQDKERIAEANLLPLASAYGVESGQPSRPTLVDDVSKSGKVRRLEQQHDILLEMGADARQEQESYQTYATTGGNIDGTSILGDTSPSSFHTTVKIEECEEGTSDGYTLAPVEPTSTMNTGQCTTEIILDNTDMYRNSTSHTKAYNIQCSTDPLHEEEEDSHDLCSDVTNAEIEGENVARRNISPSLATMVGYVTSQSSDSDHVDDQKNRYQHSITANQKLSLNFALPLRRNTDSRRKQYKTHTCTICNKQFTHKSHYTDHVRTHSGEKPFKCNQCDYSCSRNSRLNVHMRTHTTEKRFICEVCNKGFSQKSSLKNHVLLHGEELYTCPSCGKLFSSSSTFDYHINHGCSKSHG